MFLNTEPGEQVVVIPDWVYRTLAKKGQIEDLVNFSKMRQWFTQEQLVAIDAFSNNGLSVFWTGGSLDLMRRHPDEKYSRSLGYIWYFPGDAGQSDITNEVDKYSRNQLSGLSQNTEYTSKLVKEYILDPFKETPKDKVDLSQSYSVYSGSDKLIVVALNQGVLSPVIIPRHTELRLHILRSVVQKLEQYYDLNVVHKTKWFEWYFRELSVLK
jgi:hypothetical protein